jgi:membrane protein YqaA with SNARE-associated domain
VSFIHSITDLFISYGIWGLLLLSVLDSAGLPVPGGLDALLIFVAVKTPRHAYTGAALAVAGSVAGNILLFMAARKGRQWTRKEEKVLAEGHPGRFERWFRRYGMITIFVPAVVPVIPLPLKVFVISAGIMRTRVATFLAVIAAARFIRYFGEAYVGIQLGEESMSWFKAHVWQMSAIALAFCAAVFAYVRWRDRQRQAVR